MNSIERSAQQQISTTAGIIEPLDLLEASAPILTPVAVAFTAGIAAGGAVWAAKNGYTEVGSDMAHAAESGDPVSIDTLLGQRCATLTD